MILLEVSNLTKSFKSYSTELKRIINWFFPIFKPNSEVVVINSLSFKVIAGEAIGLIGVNGAGKSTLLKIITGTLQPTTGVIKRGGRIAAILELGMGFNLNLTGRQNAIHVAGLMGYSLEEINKVIHELESFAEIGQYFDQPVRLYSSGMQMRVAFAVATAIRPDILIVDEALSVGDAYFQHKCLHRIKEFQKLGTTLILVSHDKTLILSICKRVILLNHGVIEKDGDPSEVLDLYNALIVNDENSVINIAANSDRQSLTSGTGEAIVEEVFLENSNFQRTEIVNVGEKIKFRLCIKIIEDIDVLVVGFLVKNKFGLPIFGTNTWQTSQVLHNVKAGEVFTLDVLMNANLGVGTYSLTTALSGGSTHLESNYEWRELAIVFSVVNLDKHDFVGLSWMDVSTSLEKKHG